jgi:hypothetical protein
VKPGCLLGIIFSVIGVVGLAIIGLLLAGYTIQQIMTEDISSFEIQEPDTELPADELPSDEQVDDNENEETTKLAGTYVGATDLPDQWSQYPGTDFVNEITIDIASNGHVSGSLAVIREGDAYNTDNNCVTFTDFDVSGTPSGELTEAKSTITIQMVYYFETRYTQGCANTPAEVSETYELNADIVISGDTMTGTVPDFFTFEATRR